MFNYYHIYPTCPHCREPNFNGISIIKSNIEDYCQNCRDCDEEDCQWDIFKYKNKAFGELYRCLSCDAVFNKYIDLSEFKETINTVEVLEENSKVPLIWNIELNSIEKDYIEWIDEIKGKYLITWPWSEVKFIPCFVIEYISKYPDNKIVIVDDFPINELDDEFLKPTSFELFESLLYSSSKIPLNQELRSEYRTFNYKNVFKKINRFHHSTTFKHRENRFTSPVNHFYGILNGKTSRNYNKLIIDDLRSEYGEDCIRENFVDGNRIDRYCNENGFINLKVDKQFSWTQKKFAFKKDQLWENIININNFNRPKNDFKYISVKSEEDLGFDDSYQIYFISKNIENVFEIVNEINPSLVLFPSADDLMIESAVYYSELGRSFRNYIENSFSDCLLFSTDKDIRHLYTKNDFLNKNGISLHTWDNNLVISQIEDNQEYTKTAGSSSFDEISESSNIQNRYVVVEDLNDFEKFISKLYEETNNKAYNEYLSRLLRSPLFAFSHDQKSLEFRLFNNDTTFESIINSLDHENPTLSDELYSIYEKIYSDNRNPILTKILNVLEKQLNKIDVKNVMIVLSSMYEVKIFQKILSYKDLELPNSVEILTWSKLNDIGVINGNSVVISTSYPQINYKLYTSNFKKFIFIGSKNYLEKIKTIVDNRVDTTNCRPIYYNDSINYPKLLNNILESSDIINDIEEAPNYFSEEEIEIPDVPEPIPSAVDSLTKTNAIIENGETAILLLDNHNNGLFIPKKYNVMYRHPTNIVAVDSINEKNYSKLKNKELVLNRNNFMISYKDIFYKYIVDEGDGIEIISETFKWENFYQLINSVFDWRNELDNCLKIMMRENPFANNLDQLATELSESNTYASDENYIKNFWLSNATKYNLKTKHGILNIYDIEIPRTLLKDLIEIFTVIYNHNDSINIQEKAYKNYVAYKQFKKIRDSFLKHERINPKYNNLYLKFKRELEQIIRRQELFRVMNIKKVKLNDSVTPFKKMTNFTDYYD